MNPYRMQSGLSQNSDAELTQMVRDVLDESGIPYVEAPGGFHWPGLTDTHKESRGSISPAADFDTTRRRMIE